MIDKKDSKSKQEILRQGMESDFWRIIISALEDSKGHLRKEQKGQDLKSLPAEQYKLENELLLAKLEYLDNLADYPNTIIGWLQNPNQKEIDPDPYDK